ncbi:MAG: hypothetical protein RL095_3914 [Verrucomicrobiota bacterium]
MRSELVLPWLLAPPLFLLARRLPRSRCSLIAAVAILPLALLPAGGYLHLWDSNPWFCEFRSRAVADFLPVFSAFSFGRLLAPCLQRLGWRDLAACALCLPAALPAFKLAVMKRPEIQFSSKWQQEVALQSTPSSCGPASCASLLRRHGRVDSEAHIARDAGTTLSGTEIWHLARVLRRRGMEVSFQRQYRLGDAPCLVGIRLGAGVGHFNAILADDGMTLILAEPLSGERRLSGSSRLRYLEELRMPVMRVRIPAN